MSHGFQPTQADLALLAELKLNPKLEDYPLTVLRLATLIYELQKSKAKSHE